MLPALLLVERDERDVGAGVTNSSAGVPSRLDAYLSFALTVLREDEGFLLLTETIRGEVAFSLCAGEDLRTIFSMGALLGVS